MSSDVCQREAAARRIVCVRLVLALEFVHISRNWSTCLLNYHFEWNGNEKEGARHPRTVFFRVRIQAAINMRSWHRIAPEVSFAGDLNRLTAR